MGLDMYLTKETDVKNWDRLAKKDRYKINARRGGKLCKHIKSERVSRIMEDVGYWRKANDVHNWLVRNVQNNVDDCGRYHVTEKNLIALRAYCVDCLEGFITADEVYEYSKTVSITSDCIASLESARERSEASNITFFGDEITFFYQSSW